MAKVLKVIKMYLLTLSRWSISNSKSGKKQIYLYLNVFCLNFPIQKIFKTHVVELLSFIQNTMFLCVICSWIFYWVKFCQRFQFPKTIAYYNCLKLNKFIRILFTIKKINQ